MGPLRLMLTADDGHVLSLECRGSLSQLVLEDPAIMERLLGPGGYSRRVILDLEQAEDIDSSGVSWLVVLFKRFREAGGRLVLHSIPPRVDHVLRLLHIDSVVPTARDARAARDLAGHEPGASPGAGAEGFGATPGAGGRP